MLVVSLAFFGELGTNIIVIPVVVCAVEACSTSFLNAVGVIVLWDDAAACCESVAWVAAKASTRCGIDCSAQGVHHDTVATNHHVTLRTLSALSISHLSAIANLSTNSTLPTVQKIPWIAAGTSTTIQIGSGTQRTDLDTTAALDVITT